MDKDSTKGLSNVIRIDDEWTQDHLKHIVRGSVEETLNALLDAEADRPCRAGGYERTEARQDTRAGSNERKFHTSAGRGGLEGSQAQAPDLRDGDHRTLPAPRGPSGGGLDRDVPGGCLGTTGGGNHGGAVGHAGSPSMRRRISVNNDLTMVTSASWKGI